MSGDRLAVIGCGAVVQRCHLPALAAPNPFRLTTLVDTADGHRRATAERYAELLAEHGVAETPVLHSVRDVRDVLGEFDAAIVASPPASHADIVTTLIQAGKHVLVEKPVACSSAELIRLRDTVAAGSAIVAPAHVRRLFPAAPWVAQALAGGRLGRLRSIRWAEGGPFAWPALSSFTFGPVTSGGGLLNDLGPHILDLLTVWLGGQAEIVSVARNNDPGGTETEAILELSVTGIPVTITLSRVRRLANVIEFEGSRRTLRVGIDRVAQYTEHDSDGRMLDEGEVPADPPELRTRIGLFGEQLSEFRRTIDGGPSRLPTLSDILPATRLIEQCHASAAQALPRPWRSAGGTRRRDEPLRVAVTGATGFIGSTVVEELLDADPETVVTALGHSVPAFARLAHLDRRRLKHRSMDIRDATGLRDAFQGCDVVVHTVYGNTGDPERRWSVTVDGTSAVTEAAVAAGVRRLVLLSSMSVYDTVAAGTLTEDSPKLVYRSGDYSYGQQKLASEYVVLGAAGAGMEVVCLQPGVVYGPWGPNWTVRPLAALATDNDSLPSGSAGGICNAVHVLDVAAAIGFLTSADGVDGRGFLLGGPDPGSWGDFYDHYRSLLGIPAHGRADHAEWPDRLRAFYAEQTAVSTHRLTALGFHPSIDLPAGMAQVGSWARWAGLA